MLLLGQDVLSAVGEPRLHHQFLPDSLEYEDWAAGNVSFSYPKAILGYLQARGQNTTATQWGGVCQVIAVDPDSGMLEAASDPRKDGAPAGF